MGNEIVVFKADKNGFDAVPATEPTLYFIGVTTGHSSIMKVFPEWSKHMGLGAVIKGIDIGIHEDPEVYRKVVEFIKNDPLSKGALVTTHKLDLCNATKDMFDYLRMPRCLTRCLPSPSWTASSEGTQRILSPAVMRCLTSFRRTGGVKREEISTRSVRAEVRFPWDLT